MTAPPTTLSTAPTSAARLVGTLTLAGLLAGLSLAGVYLLTKPRIDRNRAEALERAVLAVVPGATRFAPWREGAPVYATRDADGRPAGFAILAEGPGFADTVGLIYGFDAERRRITGMRVLESRETPGLGDGIITNAAFVGQFASLAVDPHVVPVTGGRPRGDNEVDCITGATISSRAVVGIVDASVRQWADALASSPPEDRP